MCPDTNRKDPHHDNVMYDDIVRCLNGSSEPFFKLHAFVRPGLAKFVFVQHAAAFSDSVQRHAGLERGCCSKIKNKRPHKY